MKKILCIIICFCIFITSGTLVNAANNPKNGNYILTEKCPYNVIQYAKSLLEEFPKSELKTESVVGLGEPFVLKNSSDNTVLYYFPVIINEKIEFTYRLFYYHGWNYVLSKCLVNELNSIGNSSTFISPAVVYLDSRNDNIILQTRKASIVFIDENSDLYEDTSNKIDEVTRTSIESDIIPYDEAVYNLGGLNSLHISNYKTIISSVKINPLKEDNTSVLLKSSSRPYQACYHTPVVLETQGDLPWCAAYVTAAIVSYKTGTNYYAQDVATFAGVNTSQSVSRNKCVQFAKSKGLVQTRQTLFDVDDEGMMDQIWNDGLVYVDSYRKGSLFKSHAFIVSGYCWSGTEILNWMVRNPWYNYYEYIGSDRIYTTVSGRVYKAWEHFIVDFKA